MICIEQARKYCREDISNIEGYAEALADITQTWICHIAKAAQSNKHKRKPYGTNKNKGRKCVLCADGKRHWMSKEEACHV